MSGEQNEIPELIAEYLIGGEIPRELEVWMASSEENRRFVESMCKDPNLLESIGANWERGESETAKAWSEALKTIGNLPKPASQMRKRIGSVVGIAAAAAALVILLTLATFGGGRRYPDISQVRTDGAVTSLVRPDGSVVAIPHGGAIGEIDLGEGFSADYYDGVLTYHAPSKGRNNLKEAPRNRIVVARGDALEIVFTDGTRGCFNAKSDVAFPVAFGGEERRIRLDGEAFMNVRHDPERPFVIETGSDMTVNVLGTIFNVSAYSDYPKVSVTLVEGKVEMKCEKFAYRMEPGEHLSYNHSEGGLSLSRGDTAPRTAWTRGELVFEDITLEDAMRQLMLYYDIDPVYENEAARSVRFGFKLPRYDTPEPILDFMELTSGVKFRREGGKIYITL